MVGYTKGYNYEDKITPETEMVSADQADQAIAEAVKKALAEANEANDEDETLEESELQA